MMLLLGACKEKKTTAFLPGTYVNAAIGELSQADDTLEIKSVGPTSFLIHRKTGFNLIRNGMLGKREYETELWNTVYDPTNQTLSETRRGKLITIFPDSGFIKVGKRKYIKQ